MTDEQGTGRGRIERYFEQEYNYLQMAGEEFAEKHKLLGSRLKLSERERKDPFVERLFEAFAFLAGRIHERLDDEWPELAGTLLDQLFPHLLRPFPSCAILEARHRPGLLVQPTVIPRGSEVQTPRGKVQLQRRVSSAPGQIDRTVQKEEPAEFIFRTTQDLIVRPLRIVSVTTAEIPDGGSSLVLRFQMDRNISYGSLGLQTLRLFLHGAHSLRYAMLLYFARHVAGIGVREVGPEGSASFKRISECRVTFPALASSEAEDLAILPFARQTFAGYRLLQEYFAFPDRFFFVDIQGLDAFAASSAGYPFEIQFTFDRRFPREHLPGADNIRLHCAPIVNLFDRQTEPVAVDHRLPEYYLNPGLDRRWSREIYAVRSVTTAGDPKAAAFIYSPVTSYDVLDTSDASYAQRLFYSVVRRPPSESGAMGDTYLRLFGRGLLEQVFPNQTLSIQAIISNGTLPAAKVEAGVIKEPVGESFPPGIEVSNLTIPTPVLNPPDRSNYVWALVSHLVANIKSLADTESLKTILSLYNWSPAHSNPNKKRIQGIRQVHPITALGLLPRQGFVRGMEFKIEVEPGGFENGEGEIYLFGAVLHRFLTEYVSINSVVSLTMVETGTGRESRWLKETGKIPPI
jgi:type VI secretion system protein ImpG